MLQQLADAGRMLVKLSADVDLIQLEAWKRWWADFARLEYLASLDVWDQAATFRLSWTYQCCKWLKLLWVSCQRPA